MKEIAWYLLGFSAAVCAVAFGLLLAPDTTERSGGLLQHLTPTEVADLIVAVVFAAVASSASAAIRADR